MILSKFIICICCAVVFGFFIGLERQLTGHAVGIRTNILVSEEELNTYVLSVTCRDENEFGIRSVMINKLNNSRLHLIHLESADEIGGKVEIKATVQISGKRRDEHIEKLTAQIALEKGINKVGWEMEAGLPGNDEES